MNIELTVEEQLKMLKAIFMDDEKYDEQLVSQLSEEEYQRFLVACPEFLKESEWAKKRAKKEDNQ